MQIVQKTSDSKFLECERRWALFLGITKVKGSSDYSTRGEHK